MATVDEIRSARASNWALTGLILLALGLSVAGLHSVIDGIAWWFPVMLVGALVLLAAAVVRSFARRRGWSSLAAFVAAVVVITVGFAPGTGIVWVIPTVDTFEALRKLEAAGIGSIAAQETPAQADPGILYLLCLGVAAIAVALDVIAFTLRTRALVGAPLLVLLLVPSLVDSSLSDPLFFVLTAAAYLAILLVGSRRSTRRTAVGIGGVALVAALIVPLGMPAVQSTGATNGTGGAVTTGINPILNMGSDLRRGDPRLALTYTSSQPGGQYLRLTALDDFSGAAWAPTDTTVIAGNDVNAIGAAPGLTPEVPTTTVTTSVTVGNIQSRWLPAPYAPSRVTGLTGTWGWEPDGLAIRTTASNAREQEYVVESVQVAPSIEQLVAAGTTVEPGMERYLQIPDDLPPVVAETALTVVGAAATNYEKALALQDFFRGGDFTYSEEAPVDDDYDGSGAAVLDDFLAAKAGYCVHFSSAMAAMARTLGIPARVAVGFTPGDATPTSASPSPSSTAGADDPVEYRVTTHDLHAWPELYFVGIGWVRFEPTPGRGVLPAFAPLAADDPATPEVDESVPSAAPTSAPSSAPTTTPEDVTDPTDETTASGSTPRAATPPWGLLFLLLLFVPWVVRAVRRGERMRLVARGSASAAWDELRATADDLGIAMSDTRTPRQLSAGLADHLDDTATAALARLRVALESEAFAETPGIPATKDARAVARALRSSVPTHRRVLATLLPRSLFVRWLPAVAPAE